MMNESEYHALAGDLLDAMAEALEEADANGDADVELEGSVLTIVLSSGQHYLISKHAPSRQIWVSSPVSGGLHFSYDGGQWKLADGRELLSFVAGELASLGHLQVRF